MYCQLSYAEPILPDEQLSPDKPYQIVLPSSLIIRCALNLPTSTSDLPLHINIPLPVSSTVGDVIEHLVILLSLPITPSDLLAPSLESSGGGLRSYSLTGNGRVSGSTSGSSSDKGVEGDSEELRWKVMLDGKALDLASPLQTIMRGRKDHIMHVSLDEDCILEQNPSHCPTYGTSVSHLESHVPLLSPEDNTSSDDRTPTATLASPPRAISSPYSPSMSAGRLSGLFEGWLDANQHPAPPPSPQVSLNGRDIGRIDNLGMGGTSGRLKLEQSFVSRALDVESQARRISELGDPEVSLTHCHSRPSVND